MTYEGDGNQSETNTQWCARCGWCRPAHVCGVIVMPPDVEAAAIASLEGATAANPARGKNEIWWTAEGWKVWVFDDAGHWDYIHELTSPSGVVWEHPFRPRSGRAMTERLCHWFPRSKDGWPGLELDLDDWPPEGWCDYEDE